MSEVEVEPVRGLPERLPPGERILWQGSPDVRSLARRAFHVRKLAVYFAVLLGWRVASGFIAGKSLVAVAVSSIWFVPLALAAVGLPALLAWLYARTTVYTITNRRVVIRFGVALPMSLNLPFRIVAAAGLRTYADGTGDIPLTLRGPDRIAYLHLWPNARPWRINQPEPMLRGVAQAAQVAETLAGALAATTVPSIVARPVEGQRSAQPSHLTSAAA